MQNNTEAWAILAEVNCFQHEGDQMTFEQQHSADQNRLAGYDISNLSQQHRTFRASSIQYDSEGWVSRQNVIGTAGTEDVPAVSQKICWEVLT